MQTQRPKSLFRLLPQSFKAIFTSMPFPFMWTFLYDTLHSLSIQTVSAFLHLPFMRAFLPNRPLSPQNRGWRRRDLRLHFRFWHILAEPVLPYLWQYTPFTLPVGFVGCRWANEQDEGCRRAASSISGPIYGAGLADGKEKRILPTILPRTPELLPRILPRTQIYCQECCQDARKYCQECCRGCPLTLPLYL